MSTPNHPHQSCRDRDCERPYCQIWREARAEGYEHGREDGFDEGLAACQATHDDKE
jgi:hypothetical protein